MSMGGGKAIERTVDSLEDIYAVVIALAISQAIQSLLREPSGSTGVSFQRLSEGWPAFVAFIVTLVPFWHGMNRHLDRCYLQKTGHVAQRAIIIDFAAFFIEACFLFAAGWSLRFGIDTFLCLGALLAVDSMWAVISHFIHFPGKKSHAIEWASINVAAIAAGFFVIMFPFGTKPLVLMGVAIVRTIADYWRSPEFYFPTPSVVHD